MKNELYFYDIYPKVLLTEKKTAIHIKPLSAHVAFLDCEYTIKIFPMTYDIYSQTKPQIKSYTATPKNGLLVFEHAFEGEQEHSIRIFKSNDLDKIIVSLSVYSVKEDLYCRYPYMGDFHVHTCFSDGIESPEFVASMYRQHGFDFISITDHYRMDSSLRAIEKYKDVELDFKLYRGEEVHTPNNHVHIVNFGSDFSVNEYNRNHTEKVWDSEPKEEWFKEVESLQNTLEQLPEGVDPFIHASCLLAIKKIHEGNGMAIFCHPHWIADVYHVADSFTKFYLENNFADCFELVGGQSNKENMMQISLYNEIKSKGFNIPIVGSSDSHGTVNRKYFTESKTIVLAKSNTREDIIEAVKNLYSIAVDEYKGQNYHVHSSYRLSSYAIFLIDNYFPLHNELCFEEGRLMRAYINGDIEAKERLELIKGQTIKLIEKYFMIGKVEN